MTAHHWVPILGRQSKKASCTIHWPVCKRCGLVKLKNAATEKAARMPCPDED